MEQFSCDEILFEKFFLGGHAHDPRSIELRGAIKAVAECADIKWREIHPSTARANLGVGRINKDPQLRDVVCDLFKIPAKYRPDENKKKEVFMPPDVFDACVLAWSSDRD